MDTYLLFLTIRTGNIFQSIEACMTLFVLLKQLSTSFNMYQRFCHAIIFDILFMLYI